MPVTLAVRTYTNTTSHGRRGQGEVAPARGGGEAGGVGEHDGEQGEVQAQQRSEVRRQQQQQGSPGMSCLFILTRITTA